MSLGEADQSYNDERELRKTHTKISAKKKEKLIQFVIKENMSVYRAAERLKICHPTAKFIVKNYRLAHHLPRQAEAAPKDKAKAPLHPTQSPQIQKDDGGMSPTQLNVDSAPEMMQPALDQASLLANLWAFYGNSCVFQPFYYYS